MQPFKDKISYIFLAVVLLFSILSSAITSGIIFTKKVVETRTEQRWYASQSHYWIEKTKRLFPDEEVPSALDTPYFNSKTKKWEDPYNNAKDQHWVKEIKESELPAVKPAQKP